MMLIASLEHLARKTATTTIPIGDCKTTPEFLERAASVLRGNAYGGGESKNISPRNFDAFVEYVEDWYETNWGRSVVVQFTGVDRLHPDILSIFLMIVCAIHMAECNILENRINCGEKDARDKLERLIIVIG